jgi:hypothetical protein
MLAGVASGAVLSCCAATATAAHRAEAPAWVVTPATDSCRTELELTGSSGAVAPVALVSDGDGVELVFEKADAPERAFLPIRVDHKPYANLVMRQADGRTAAMQLSADTLTALKKGGSLQISWLADEPVEATLTGSDQALSDLRTCGAQVSERFHEQQTAQRDAQSRADSEARAKELADEQLAAAKAQKAAAEAEAQRSAAEAEHLRLQTDSDRQRAQAEAEAERYADQQAEADAYPYPRVRGYQSPRYGYAPQAPPPYPPYDGPPQPYRGW